MNEIAKLDHSLGAILPDETFPIIIRPVGSHAGRGLQQLNCLQELIPYIQTQPDDEFFLSRFIDYASADGAFRKYRIVFIDGQPFPVHMAIADEWRVWYMNAGMEEDALKRGEEQAFMARFQRSFAKRHERVFTHLCKRVDLEYFGIDCAEDRDGNLVIFEVDNALIVHDMDPVDIYPYKKPTDAKNILCIPEYDTCRELSKENRKNINPL